MKVLAHVHKYPPLHNAGAEAMLHEVLLHFIAQGHEAYVTHPNRIAPYRLDGVVVFPTMTARELHDAARDADVVITHLDRTANAVAAARTQGKPLVHLVHNERQLAFHHVTPDGGPTLVVFNSEWIAREVRWRGDSLICRPPVSVDRYLVPETDRRPADVTLINVTIAKGSAVFYELAEANRARSFLGVMGAYGVQDVGRRRRLRNVELIGNTPDIVRDVYARTRVLLMPSGYESWGRVAIEAAANGIPTIAHPTPGLRESLGDAGLFAQRAKVNEWKHHLEALDDDDAYREASDRARARADELEKLTHDDLVALERAVLRLTGKPHAYPADVGILSTVRAGLRCPVCQAASCSCKPTGGEVAASITVVNAPSRAEAGERALYRTWRGDWLFDRATAQRRGLVSGGPELARDIIKRLEREAHLDPDELRLVKERYAGAAPKSRDAFLATLALIRPNRIAGELAAVLDALGTPTRPAEPTTPAESDDLVSGRVGEVLDRVGDDKTLIGAALKAERAGRGRGSLIAALNRRLEEL